MRFLWYLIRVDVIYPASLYLKRTSEREAPWIWKGVTWLHVHIFLYQWKLEFVW